MIKIAMTKWKDMLMKTPNPQNFMRTMLHKDINTANNGHIGQDAFGKKTARPRLMLGNILSNDTSQPNTFDRKHLVYDTTALSKKIGLGSQRNVDARGNTGLKPIFMERPLGVPTGRNKYNNPNERKEYPLGTRMNSYQTYKGDMRATPELDTLERRKRASDAFRNKPYMENKSSVSSDDSYIKKMNGEQTVKGITSKNILYPFLKGKTEGLNNVKTNEGTSKGVWSFINPTPEEFDEKNYALRSLHNFGTPIKFEGKIDPSGLGAVPHREARSNYRLSNNEAMVSNTNKFNDLKLTKVNTKGLINEDFDKELEDFRNKYQEDITRLKNWQNRRSGKS